MPDRSLSRRHNSVFGNLMSVQNERLALSETDKALPGADQSLIGKKGSKCNVTRL